LSVSVKKRFLSRRDRMKIKYGRPSSRPCFGLRKSLFPRLNSLLSGAGNAQYVARCITLFERRIGVLWVRAVEIPCIFPAMWEHCRKRVRSELHPPPHSRTPPSMCAPPHQEWLSFKKLWRFGPCAEVARRVFTASIGAFRASVSAGHFP